MRVDFTNLYSILRTLTDRPRPIDTCCYLTSGRQHLVAAKHKILRLRRWGTDIIRSRRCNRVEGATIDYSQSGQERSFVPVAGVVRVQVHDWTERSGASSAGTDSTACSGATCSNATCDKSAARAAFAESGHFFNIDARFSGKHSWPGEIGPHADSRRSRLDLFGFVGGL